MIPDSFFNISDSVISALRKSEPVVALETTVLTHGLPPPLNLSIVQELDEILTSMQVTPALIGILKGRVVVGMSLEEVEELISSDKVMKVSSSDIGLCCAGSGYGGTTVSATIQIANAVGIKVFATGGIGGVHRGDLFDISNDIFQLSKTPVFTVCSGAKVILNLKATFERLETYGIPVIGYRTDSFPAFYTSDSGIGLQISVSNVRKIREISEIHWGHGANSSVLVVNPPPSKFELDKNELDNYVVKAHRAAEKEGVSGKQLTPYLLKLLSEYSNGATIRVNLELLKSNVRLAGEIAHEITR